MSQTKIVFSNEEQLLLHDTAIWHTKTVLTEKLYQLLGEVNDEMSALLAPSLKLFLSLEHIPSKISRGENYMGHPYMMLDAPNLFTKEKIFAIRNFIWFGHYAASYLVISGSYLNVFNSGIHLPQPIPHNLYVCINDNPWQHSFTIDNMKPVHKPEDLSNENNFIKLGFKFPLKEANQLKENFLDAYVYYMRLITQSQAHH